MAALKDEETDVLADPGLSVVFTHGGRLLRAGVLCCNPALADALEGIGGGGKTDDVGEAAGGGAPHRPTLVSSIPLSKTSLAVTNGPTGSCLALGLLPTPPPPPHLPLAAPLPSMVSRVCLPAAEA